MGQRENGVDIRNFEQPAFEFIYPLLALDALAYHAMTVTTAMKNEMFVTTIIAMDGGTTERRCFAASDGTNQFNLLKRRFVYLNILLPVVSEKLTDTIFHPYWMCRESIGCLMYR